MAFETETGARAAKAKLSVSQVKFDPLVDLSNEAMIDLVSNLEMVRDVPLQVTVELGRVDLPLKHVVQLTDGSVIALDKLAGEPVDLLVNGTPIARGEVVVIDEQFGLRLTQVLTAGAGTEAAGALEPEPPAAPEPIAG